MLTYLLQLEPNGHYSEDTAVVARLIDEHNWMYPNNRHKLIEMKLNDLTAESIYSDYIPVGSVDFVNKTLELMGSKPMKPINIPEELHSAIFLQRRISICPGGEVITRFSDWRTDKLFVKSAQRLKADFTDIYKFRDFQISPTLVSKLDDECFVSEVVKFQSEWRCFVYKGELKDMKCYLGDFWTMPNQTFIEACIDSMPTDLDAYTLDVGVLEDGANAVIEVHNFLSCGLYGFDDSCILNMLKHAFQKERDPCFINAYDDWDAKIMEIFKRPN